MKLYIVKDSQRYNIEDHKKVDRPFVIKLISRSLNHEVQVNQEDEVVYFKRVVGAFNSSFRTVFHCFGIKENKFWYNSDLDILFRDESMINQLIPQIYWLHQLRRGE